MESTDSCHWNNFFQYTFQSETSEGIGLDNGYFRFVVHLTVEYLLMIGVETRTSSPVRIVRDKETLQHVTVRGLFPCGEGAGYAGGIVSAGVDGERCAEAVANYINH